MIFSALDALAFDPEPRSTFLPSSPNERRDDRRGGRGGGRGSDRDWPPRGGGGGYGDSYGDRGGGGGGFGGGGGGGERPAHLRLNLAAPSRAPTSSSFVSGSSDNSSRADDGDKWSNVFSKKNAGMTFGQAGMGTGMRGGGSGSGGDARFANSFGGGGGGGGGYGRSRTSPETEAAWAQDPAEIAREREAAEAKAAKKKENEETKRKEKEAREAAAAAEEAAKQAEQEKVEQAKQVAKQVYSTGLKGNAIVEHVAGLAEKPTGATMLVEIFANYDDVKSLKWCTKDEYGALLSHLIGTDTKQQVAALNETQRYCHSLKFPKVDVKGTMKSLFERFFTLYYQLEIINEDGFSAWQDDEDDTIPGRVDAVVQTTAFMGVIFAVSEDEEGDGDEEEDEDEIDAPQETA